MLFKKRKTKQNWAFILTMGYAIKFLHPEVEEQQNSSGVSVKNREILQGKNPYFSWNSLGTNRNCMEFLRAYHIIRKILEG